MKYFWLSCVISLVAILIFILLWYIDKKRYENFVKKNSFTYRNVLKINDKYSFYSFKSLVIYHDYDNESMYDDISCEDYLIYYLQFNRESIVGEIKKLEANRKLYSTYREELKTINELGKYVKLQRNLNYKN